MGLDEFAGQEETGREEGRSRWKWRLKIEEIMIVRCM